MLYNWHPGDREDLAEMWEQAGLLEGVYIAGKTWWLTLADMAAAGAVQPHVYTLIPLMSPQHIPQDRNIYVSTRFNFPHNCIDAVFCYW